MTARYEVAGLVGVLVISGLLTALAPPVPTGGPLPFPPPPSGPVVAVGGRTGFIGIGITASSGQLLVRLSTPDLAPTLGEAADTRYQLAGILMFRGQDPTTLRFRECGAGCFVAAVEWASGSSTVTLRAAADGWTGGTTAVNLAWPPRPAPRLLRRAVRIMRRVATFTLHEQVTSDTSMGPGQLHRLRLTGPEFLASGPYGSGIAPVVVVLARDPAATTIGLAYPGEGTYSRLVIDSAGRILRETLAAPNHLIERTFVYPEADEAPHPEGSGGSR